MPKKKVINSIAAFEKALKSPPKESYVLRLYITGSTPNSARAIANVKKLCDEHLQGRYELEVIDLYQQPDQAKDDQIIAAPTLIKKFPLPLRRIIGDLSKTEHVLVELNLKKKKS